MAASFELRMRPRKKEKQVRPVTTSPILGFATPRTILMDVVLVGVLADVINCIFVALIGSGVFACIEL
jgi:hypothetical protein